MINILLTSMIAIKQDTLNLNIGSPGTVQVRMNTIVDTKTGKSSNVNAIAKAADKFEYVYLGESHDVAAHHQMQADVIEALVKQKRDVVVGFEMFTRPIQPMLYPWSLGYWSEAEFIKNADWKNQWGFDFGLYRPIFDITKKYRLPMVAMNVPRTWVRAVSRGGFAGLTPEMKSELPGDMDLSNSNHKQVWDSMMGGHTMQGVSMDNMYSAQVLWDESMADSALKAMAARPDRQAKRTVFVVVAGSGHVMYGQGVNWRIQRRTGAKGVTLVCVDSDKEVSVAKGVGDYVYLSQSPKREN